MVRIERIQVGASEVVGAHVSSHAAGARSLARVVEFVVEAELERVIPFEPAQVVRQHRTLVVRGDRSAGVVVRPRAVRDATEAETRHQPKGVGIGKQLTQIRQARIVRLAQGVELEIVVQCAGLAAQPQPQAEFVHERWRERLVVDALQVLVDVLVVVRLLEDAVVEGVEGDRLALRLDVGVPEPGPERDPVVGGGHPVKLELPLALGMSGRGEFGVIDALRSEELRMRRVGHEVEQALARRIDPLGGDHIAREGHARHVVHHRNQRAILVEGLREVAASLQRGRDGGAMSLAGLLNPPDLATDEEEHLVFFDRPAEHAAEGIEAIRRPVGAEAIVVERVRVEHLIAFEPVAGAVELVRARLGNDVHLGSGYASVLRLIRGRLDAHLLDGVHAYRDMERRRIVDVIARHAVQHEVVPSVAGT